MASLPGEHVSCQSFVVAQLLEPFVCQLPTKHAQNTFNWALSNFVLSLISASGVFVSLQMQSHEQFKGNLLWLQELLCGWSQDGFLLCLELPLFQKHIKNYMKVSF